MKLFKKSTAIILMICMVVSTCFLTACSSDKDKDNKSDSSKKENSSAADTSKSDSSKEDSSKEDSSEAEKPAPTNPNISAKWDSNQFSIDGKIFTLPCKLTDLEAAGYKLSSDKDKSIQPKNIVFGVNLKDTNGHVISGRYYNSTDKAIPLSECTLVNLSISSNITANSTFNMVLPGNITLQSTKDDVIKAYGNPTKITDKEGSSFILLEYQKSNADKLEIHFSSKTGKMTEYYRRTM